jgi:hypothetical protein
MGLFGGQNHKKEKEKKFWFIGVKNNDVVNNLKQEPIFEDKKQAEQHLILLQNRSQYRSQYRDSLVTSSMKFDDESIKRYQEQGFRFVFKSL